jgi:hypothetical protein
MGSTANVRQSGSHIPTIGDAGMEKDDQVAARARTVTGDTGGRSRTRGHGFPLCGEGSV